MRPNYIKVCLTPGLGNQLFQYTAATYYAKKFDMHLKFYFLNSKTLPGVKKDIGCRAFDLKLSTPFFTSLLPLYTKYIQVLERLNCFRIDDLIESRGDFLAEEFLLDRDVLQNRKSVWLYGYFQDFRYFQIMREEQNFQFVLENPSESFYFFKKLIRDYEPIIIHLRRGDYMFYRLTLGVLDFNYYLDALSALMPTQNQLIWIFTDELESAKQLKSLIIKKFSKVKVQVINQTVETNDAETLILMSHTKNLIISNSTFSLWSGYLNSNLDANIFYPQPWTVTNKPTTNLIPSNWRPVNSIWL